MADIINFQAKAKQLKSDKQKQQRKSHILCKNGHHKWKVVTENKFDVKQGKLVTCYKCEHCGKEKVKAH